MLKDLLAQRKTAIWESWREGIFSTYPERSGQFFARQKDSFANPVGATISEATEVIVGALVQGSLFNAEGALEAKASKQLERMIKIRSIQEFSPSEAVSFVLIGLRDALRRQLKGDLDSSAELRQELRQLEDGPLTQLGLQAFEIYVACRERLYNVRVNELKRSVHTMRRRFANPDLEDPFERKSVGLGPDAQPPAADDEGESK